MKGYYDIVGDGGSNVLGQVDAQQQSLVRSLSQGRASFSMEFLKYDLAPPSTLEEMLR